MENLKITKGECNIEHPLAGDFILHVDYVRIISVHLIENKLEEQEANAKLIADSFNTAQKCNLLPSELLEQRDELLEKIKDSGELIELLLNKIGCQTESAAPKSDAEDYGGASLLRAIKQTIKNIEQ